MNPKLRKSLKYLSIGVVVFIIISTLSIVVAGVSSFQIDLIPSFIASSIGFVVLLVILWMKFAKHANVSDADERYD